jgi:hypothetical protein
MHNPLTNQAGNSCRPEKPTTTARMATIRIETVHDSMVRQIMGLKAYQFSYKVISPLHSVGSADPFLWLRQPDICTVQDFGSILH